MESPLRVRRQECGLTQFQLAERAGVSRQLVAAVEAGQNAPAVDAALRLAGALRSTVEQLFAPPAQDVLRALEGELRDGVPLRIGRVGERLVAAELPDHGTAGGGWAAGDGVLEDGGLRLFPGADIDGLVLAGCDPALGIAEAMLTGLGRSRLIVLSAPTDIALGSLAAGRLHAAAVHGPADRLPVPPIPVTRIHLARWQVGLGLGPAHPARTVEGVLGSGVAIVQRDRGAASQQALERAAARLRIGLAPGPRAAGHLDAARLATTLGCAAVTTDAAANAFGLRFLAVEEHTVEIWLAREWAHHVAVEPFGNLIAGAAFTQRVAVLGGYDLAGCGTIVG
ncbi:MAG TPA: helix-turn-helix domain-containing protein [Solirubrobacteraceae bacterium]|nr:helix-turn-helix domain-containing protein [Solirubrobacteraceae bacterium]